MIVSQIGHYIVEEASTHGVRVRNGQRVVGTLDRQPGKLLFRVFDPRGRYLTEVLTLEDGVQALVAHATESENKSATQRHLMNKSEILDKLAQIDKLAAELLSGLDIKQATCSECKRMKFSNWVQTKIGDSMQGVRNKVKKYSIMLQSGGEEVEEP